ncbi:regulatory protein GemA [uncultured Methylophaga sp.]|uniref:regulatory protein GemA n=1 Tax=uncultured Methylophaga sp. TaxID=285271 RepID=UPI00260E6CC2|nr:regulatory protein GemA [uncultured Methylophaga sp.]
MNNRQKLIQLIHIGAGRLFKDEDSRRDWQEQHTGKRSCSKMTDKELQYLVKLLRDAKAIKPPKRAGRVPSNLQRVSYMRKIEALLADMDLSWEYAETIAWHVTGGKGQATTGRPGVERLEWVNKREHFEAIIAALYKEQKKRRLLQTVEHLLDAMNLNESYVEQLVAGRANARNWRRNVPLLSAIADHLYEKVDFENAAE